MGAQGLRARVLDEERPLLANSKLAPSARTAFAERMADALNLRESAERCLLEDSAHPTIKIGERIPPSRLSTLLRNSDLPRHPEDADCKDRRESISMFE